MPSTDCLLKAKPRHSVYKYNSKAYVYVILLLLAFTNTQRLLVTEKTTKKFRSYEKAKSDYTTLSTFLDFTEGRWLYFKNLGRVEFHSKNSGFLNWSNSTSRFYKIAWLKGRKRVLVFPLTPREGVAYRNLPFVDKSVLLTHPNEKVEEIFNGSPSQVLSDCFNNSKFAAAVDPSNFMQLGQAWNFFPFLDPQLPGKMVGNTYTNHFGAVLEFGKEIRSAMVNPNPLFQQEEAQMLALNKSLLFKGFMNKIGAIVFYEDFEILNFENDNQKKTLQYIRIKSLNENMISYLMQHAPNFKENVNEYVDTLYNLIYPLCEHLFKTFLIKNTDKYLNDYFSDPDIKGIQSNNDKRLGHWQKYLFDEPVIDFNAEVLDYIFEKNEKKEDVSQEEEVAFGAIDQMLEDSIQKFNDLAKRVLANTFGEIHKYFEENSPDYLPDLDEFVAEDPELRQIDQQMRQAGHYDRVSKIKDTQAFLSNIEDSQLQHLFITFLGLEGISQAIMRLEMRSWGTQIKNWKYFSKLSMDIYADSEATPNNVQWFRQLLVMVAEMDTDAKRDEKFMSFEAFQMFDVERRLLVI